MFQNCRSIRDAGSSSSSAPKCNTLRYVSTSHSTVIHQALEDVIAHAHQFGNRSERPACIVHLNVRGGIYRRLWNSSRIIRL
ncbi:hypothetical protein [Escherichia coli]|uniref:hypothetical protein n=1 Tax=Escherichia coli TaxID=562 RepID=UPI001F1150BE|nr:hypothetical protein [Escherichia coli]